MPMDLWKLKLICGFVIFVVTFLPSILPFKLFSIRWGKICGFWSKKCKRYTVEDTKSNSVRRKGEEEDEEDEEEVGGVLHKIIVGHMMCFGGGVFFGTYLLHMSVEVHAIIAETYLNEVSYPLPSLIMGIGFFMVLTTDQLVTSYRSRQLKKKKQLKKGQQKAVDNDSFENDLEDGVVKSNQVDFHNNIHNKNPHDNHHHDDKETAAEIAELHHHQHATRSIVLVLALSLHHIFEGMSIGLQKNFKAVWLLTLSVLIHEVVICFSLGLQFYKADKKLTKKIFIILFLAACILPLGVFIGLIISEVPESTTTSSSSETSDVVNGVLQAIATGTFIYVTFFEILFEELGGHNSTISRVIATILGFTLMALLGLVPDGTEEVHTVSNTTPLSNHTLTH